MRRTAVRSMMAVIMTSLLVAVSLAVEAEVPASVALDELARPNDWRTTGAHVRAARSLRVNGRPTLHARVPLRDDTAADWPKLWHAVSPDLEANWRTFDRLEFYIMARLSPPRNVPTRNIAIQLLCPDRKHAVTTSVSFDELDRWTRVSLPLAEISTLEQLKAIQLYFARRRYAGIDVADFYLGGFRLVRDAGPLADDAVLTTPLPSLSKSQLIIEAATDAELSEAVIPLRLEHDDTPHTLLARHTSEPGRFEVDLAELQLPPGQHRLIMFPDQTDRRRVASLRWLPFAIDSTSLGETLVGRNQAQTRIRSESPKPESVELVVRLDDTQIATRQIVLNPNTITDAGIVWPLRHGQRGTVQLQVYWKSEYLGGTEQHVEAPDVLGSTTQPRPLTFAPGEPIMFQIPVMLAAESRNEAVVHWELVDAHERVKQRGHSPVTGTTASLRLAPFERADAGRYQLRIELQWALDESTATQPLLFVEGPFSR